MNYFPATIGSEKVTIDGVKVKNKMELISTVTDLPLLIDSSYRYRNYPVVALNDEAYFLDGNNYKLRKWDGIVWSDVADMPFTNDARYSAVALNNEIYVLGQSFYKWDGDTWEQLSPHGYRKDFGTVTVLNNEIHVFHNATHYKWDGNTWSSVSTLPYAIAGIGSQAVVLNNEIYIAFAYNNGGQTTPKFIKWNGSTWTELSVPWALWNNGLMVVLNDEIHVLEGKGWNYSQDPPVVTGRHYVWNGSTWNNIGLIGFPNIYNNAMNIYSINSGSAIVLKGQIHVFGAKDDYYQYYNAQSRHHIIDANVYRHKV